MAEVYFIAHALGNPGVFEISISFEKNIKMKKNVWIREIFIHFAIC